MNPILTAINFFKRKFFAQQLLSNIFWAFLGRFSALFGQFIAGICAARFLGPTQFGILNYVISLVTIFSVLAAFGLDFIEIRELSKKEVVVFWMNSGRKLPVPTPIRSPSWQTVPATTGAMRSTRTSCAVNWDGSRRRISTRASGIRWSGI